MRYFFWFWLTVISRAFSIIVTRKKETRRAYCLLDEIEKKYNGHFRAATRKKIAVSYGIYLPMVCRPFARLTGKKISQDERIRFIHYFICSSLFDDFTDYALINEKQLYNLSFHYEDYECHLFDETVFKESHRLLRVFVRDKNQYDEVSHKLFEAQERSKAQYRSQLSPEEIRRITFDKGGYAVLLCAFYMDYSSTPGLQECWYRLGTLIQLINDLYDIHKDLQDEITTLPNTMQNVLDFERFFIGEIEEMNKQIAGLPESFRRKQDFSLSMAGIYAFGLIALQQLKEIQGNATQMPNMADLDRKQLIIDMEKKQNLFLWFKFTYRYARLAE